MNFKNLALGYVATAPSPATTGTSLTLDSGEGARFPQPSTDGNFYVTAMPPGKNPNVDNSEILQVTARSTDTLTIVREQGDTTAKTIEAGWIILQSIYKENILDEDDMASNSATALATQQSIKAYVGTPTSVASSATPTPTGDRKRNELYITALEEAAELQAPSGTPVNGNILIIRVKDNGTARDLTYNAIYSGILDTLPATTTLGKVLYMGFLYNSTTSKWELVAMTEEG